MQGIFEKIKIIPSKKKSIKILHDVNGIVRPSRLVSTTISLKKKQLPHLIKSQLSFVHCVRMTLLLGPPGSGKTILLKALAGKLDKDLRVCDCDCDCSSCY